MKITLLPDGALAGPEPETYALVLAGLVLVAGARRVVEAIDNTFVD